MNDAQALAKLLKAESILKQTEAAYSETGPRWKIAMPLLWEVRKDINSTVLGEKLAVAHGLLKETEKGYDPQAPRWQKAMAIIDDVEAELHRTPVPNLGPVLKGDKSLLLWVPTHQTDGLFRGTGSHYPAFDSGFGQVGRTIVAPERLKVPGSRGRRRGTPSTPRASRRSSTGSATSYARQPRGRGSTRATRWA